MKLLTIEELNGYGCDYSKLKTINAHYDFFMDEDFEFFLKKPIYNDAPLIYVLFKIRGLTDDLLMESSDAIISLNLKKGDEAVVYTHKNMEITSSKLNVFGISK